MVSGDELDTGVEAPSTKQSFTAYPDAFAKEDAPPAEADDYKEDFEEYEEAAGDAKEAPSLHLRLLDSSADRKQAEMRMDRGEKPFDDDSRSSSLEVQR